MLSEKSKSNIADFVSKVTSAEGGAQYLGEVLSFRAEIISAIIDRAIASTAAYLGLKSTLEKRGMTLLKDVSLLVIPKFDPERLKNAKIGIAIDTETDGRDIQSVIDLGMVRFFYDDQGIICIDGSSFSMFRDSGTEIAEEAGMVHGISQEDIKGCVITRDDILKYTQGVELFIAHNSSFDRKILERDFPDCEFDTTAWGCSLMEVDWKKFGIVDRKLELICLRQGFTYPSHRAAPDSLALVHALMLSDGKGGAFLDLLESTRRTKVMICLERVPFEVDSLMNETGLTPQEFLKKNGFRFSQEDGPAGVKCWFKLYDSKLGLIQDSAVIRQAYDGAHVELPIRVLDAKTLYSDRLPPLVKAGFRTAVPHLTLGFDLLHGNVEDVPAPKLPETEEEMLASF